MHGLMCEMEHVQAYSFGKLVRSTQQLQPEPSPKPNIEQEQSSLIIIEEDLKKF